MIRQTKESGFLLAELMVYVAVLVIFMGITGATIYSTVNENRVFDTTTRQLYYAMRRMQIMTQRGRTGSKQANVFSINEDGYMYDPFFKLWGDQEKTVPDTIEIILVGPNNSVPMFHLNDMNGQKHLYSMYIKDKELRRCRQYIFSQQTPRIRWEDTTY